MFTESDTNKRNVFHYGLSRKKNTLPAYRSQGGGVTISLTPVKTGAN
ncbi:hypothetical protein NT01EI_2360 [Edwardsiella ictaluri 93-146]|uniref:Uncharacterized protein n=1 Tax=Edwardsiella ictaluri (strain 93-146) TaxID=634503 RepID=C5B8G1_EDWI9|nr:hypothetical protein NT01EI_2360 [Edwardsiella ictaluri 93-146]